MKKSSLILLIAGLLSLIVFIAPPPTQAQATPNPPTLLSPTNGEQIPATLTGGKAQPTFTWSIVDGIGDWRINIYNGDLSVNFFKTLPQITYGQSYTLLDTEALGFGNYQWRIRARYSGETTWGTWSAPFAFSVVPKAPVLTAPANGATITDNTPTLTWNNVPGNTPNWQVNYYNGTINPFVETGMTSYEITTPLADGTYNWRVRAQSLNGIWGLWSAVYTFTVAA
ncbi:MAG: DUF4962 domain-containing protein, partial [Chloroflexi bacterium]|nr:DUF4962 domain-containing protein [Chloroflexota bacterium]